MPLKVALISPLWERVPPPAYGGTEAIVSLLADGLSAAGVDVTLFASGDSLTTARLRSVYHRSLRTAEDLKDPSPYDWLHAATALRDSRDFDLIHNHAGELPMAMSQLATTPMLTTMHCLVTPDTRIVWDHYSGWFNTISHSSANTIGAYAYPNFLGVVYNAIDVSSFPFSHDKDDYLLYLARIAPEKGPHLAIEVARRLGMRLILAGKVDRVDRAFYHDAIAPLIDGEQIVYVGEADATYKRELYVRARCLLLPICWEEPFGLAMPEAMACGTPPIVLRRGAAPEIVVDGVTGYLCENVDDMVDAVRRLDRIDPASCRRHVEEHFDVCHLVAGYLALYERVLNESALTGIRRAASPEAHW